MRTLILLLTLCFSMVAEPLAGTKPLEMTGDPAKQMVDGILRYLEKATAESKAGRKPAVERLRTILGVTDQRKTAEAPELLARVGRPALLVDAGTYRVYAVRWTVRDGMTAEGLLFEPAGKAKARVVAIPDADQLPEQFTVSQKLAAAGCQVLSPVLINRKDTWSGNPKIRMTNQPHREFLYRMAFEVGRTPWGYETEKVLAAVDWFASGPKLPMGVWGYGEGGAAALFAAVLDERIDAAVISGYFGPRELLAKQPLYRNMFGLLKDFGDAELLALARTRTIVIERKAGPSWPGPSMADGKRRGAAPDGLAPYTEQEVEAEFGRAQAMGPKARLLLESDATAGFLRALGLAAVERKSIEIPVRGAEERQHRQFAELCEFSQAAVRKSFFTRQALWAKTEHATEAQWKQMGEEYRSKLWDGVIGRMPKSTLPLNVRTRRAYQGRGWDGYEVQYDVAPEVFGYGVLLVPRGLYPGDRRPVVVVQHGLEGRPQDLFGLPEEDRKNGVYTNFHYYGNSGSKLAERGYVVYMPQNPYIGDFRPINRWGNPLGLSLFSFILAQHDRLLDWLETLPQVDGSKIGFYGLSYGGKTAVRVPPLLGRYVLSICSGDFNEWISKVTTTEHPFTYMFTHEWEIDEFDLGSVANHSEMAKMMAPRPFMVERGHRDGVGIDEWVAGEYAAVKRFYDEMGIGDRAEFEYFNGPHMMHLEGTLEFLKKHLGR
ncbi:MAG: dienelactone hydrolase family protein [Acidobacteria bacterium]|nr:dienelactone hydrolase family protein [Acidobacteriota bacterium]